jgi:FolB domain-containing protein
MATIRITDLMLRTIIGVQDWERTEKQDVLINATLRYDSHKAIETDKIEYSVDYKTITKNIIQEVENSQYYLLERLADAVLKIVMKNPHVSEASVTVDKPQALRFARSVSVELTARRDG